MGLGIHTEYIFIHDLYTRFVHTRILLFSHWLHTVGGGLGFRRKKRAGRVCV